MKNLSALFCGLIFGIGLAMSGMTDTAKVRGFLDIFGDWIPDLLFVMGGAVFITLILFRWVLRAKPIFADQLELPTNTSIDSQLIIGAAIFGIGWGIYGYCPGPAIASLAYLQIEPFVFVILMLLGMAIGNRISKS